MPVSIEQDEGRVALDRASSEIDVGLGSEAEVATMPVARHLTGYQQTARGIGQDVDCVPILLI